MHAGRHYSFLEVFRWTWRQTLVYLAIASLPASLCMVGVPLPSLPWQPVAVMGTAVAFMTGFRSNAAYGRLWEARQIWGGILNVSRAFAIHLREFAGPAQAARVRASVLRHVAWLTALRYQLRQKRDWESAVVAADRRYREAFYQIPEDGLDVEGELKQRLDETEWQSVQQCRNRTVVLLSLHAAELQRLADLGVIDAYRHVELARLVTEMVNLQGKAERIKNFPYPRQFATMNRVFVWLFIALLPFAIAAEMQRSAPEWILMTIPLATMIAWVFHTMDRIGTTSENPFEGSPNDVPISAMCRTIEIDMLELIGDVDLPAPIGPRRQILM
ncbi:MAG: bestrophin family protein [Planctomycetota bacterium]